MNAPARLSNHPERLPLGADEFMLLSDSGAFADYGKSELIEGEIFVMNAQHARHARVKTRLARLLGDRLDQIGGGLEALVEPAVRLTGTSVPEPDIVVTGWRGEGILPLDTVRLVVEVSDTTLHHDLGRKARLYASAMVPEYWVIDVNEEIILVHGPATDGAYLEPREIRFGDPVESATIAGLLIDTDRLLD